MDGGGTKGFGYIPPVDGTLKRGGGFKSSVWGNRPIALKYVSQEDAIGGRVGSWSRGGGGGGLAGSGCGGGGGGGDT